jgi:cell division protein FtsB
LRAACVDLCGHGVRIRAMRARDIEAQVTIATLQRALDAAHQRNRELEETARAMNEKYTQALAERDTLEIRLHDSDAEARRRD